MCASEPRRIAAALLCLLAAGSVAAQSGNREQEQLRRLRQQVQQLQQQQSDSQAQLQQARAGQAEAQRQADARQAELLGLRQSLARRGQAARQAEQGLAQLGAAHDDLLAQHRQQGEQLAEQQRTVAAQRAELDRLQQQAARRARELAALTERHALQARGLQLCAASNQGLRQLGRELLQRYVDKGLAEVIAVDEPFLQTRRVALDNLVQGYEDKLDALALPEAAAGTPAGVRGAE